MSMIGQVHKLIEAENEANRKKAEDVLAKDFFAIIRRDGEV